MDGARFDRWTRALASRRTLLGGLASTVVALAREAADVGAARCKAPGRPCSRQLECCSKTCMRPDGPDGRPQGRRRCVCRQTLTLPCGGRCCTRNQTCKRGRCIHHCKDGRISGDETDRDCGGDACPKCDVLLRCDRPSDCVSGRCARIAAFTEEQTRCVECIADGDCRDATKPRCNTLGGGPGFGGVCTRCVTNDHCLDEARPFCEIGTCVQCRDELDCQSGELCEAGTCVTGFCTAHVDCAGAEFPNITCCDGICGKPCTGEGQVPDCACPDTNGPHDCVEGVCRNRS